MWIEPIKDHPPLPWEQWEYPGRAMVGDLELHGRRENVFLLLAGLFAVAAVLLPVLAEPAFAIELWIPGVERTLDLSLPAGLLVFPLTFLCADVVCELYGRRRAQNLIAVALVLTAGTLALLWAAGGIDGRVALAFVARYLVAHQVNLLLFHGMRLASGGRHLWMRAIFPALLGQLLGGCAAALVLGADTLGAISSASLGGYEIAAAAAIASAIPIALAVRGLAPFLRVRRLGDETLEAEDRPRLRAPASRPVW
jgi:hypothetical protein